MATPHQIILFEDELLGFLKEDLSSKDGIAYTWENEGVTHLHSSPVVHAFGRQEVCRFTKNAHDITPNCIWTVIVLGQGDYYVYAIGVDTPIPYVLVPSKADLYSRSKGILEIGILENKHVAIVGLGSFGSQIAIELAKAGVGVFSLFDFDRIELHNLVRHTAVIKDLGRLKTDVLEESLLGKNPYVKIHKYPVDITENLDKLDELLPEIDLVICATDNNKSRIALNRLLKERSKIGIFGRAITRAEGGDVFIYRPGCACYSCMIGKMGNVNEEITNADAEQIPQYADNPEAMVQVGLSADIEPICNMMVKLALVELSKGKDSGISSLEKDLVYEYFLWANRRDNKYAGWFPMPKAGVMPTIMRWYGARINKVEDCPLCSDKDNVTLDEGEDLETLLGNLTIE